MARDVAYRRAEEEIEEALRSRTKKLDLSSLKNSKLTELPQSLGQLSQLQSLDLSYNDLKALPDSVVSLTQLKDLDISSNQFKALPNWIGQLPNLKSLNIADNLFTTLPKSLSQLTGLEYLNCANNQLTNLPEWLEKLIRLEDLVLSNNQLVVLPEVLGRLTGLTSLGLGGNKIASLPPSLTALDKLEELYLWDNPLIRLPAWINKFDQLTYMDASGCLLSEIPTELTQLLSLQQLIIPDNKIENIPESLVHLEQLYELDLDDNPLSPELAAAYHEGIDAVMRYLRAKAGEQVVLNEAKLILIGEGEVGKSCLLGALRWDPWVEGTPSTHGIEIKPVEVIDPNNGITITLNGWDFGGQRVYRPTHQLFFSAPAVYLVVWKPREGPQQGLVKEWIKLVKHREPDAKILVVATHGGPGQRQPDVDRQELWDLFGRDTIIDFFLVDSKPDADGERPGIAALTDAIARTAAALPEMGRTVPARWQQVRDDLKRTEAAYLSLDEVMQICRERKMNNQEAQLFVSVSHRLGHLIHYEHDPLLQDIVVLKPDWLAAAISFVLDDKQTRDANGLASFARLGELWNDPTREKDFQYPSNLHSVFLRLMERFDLSYRITGFPVKDGSEESSLVAQLVPDVRPDLTEAWPDGIWEGEEQQTQICQIVEIGSGKAATSEGLFYQLIVRLHKYSLGRVNFSDSRHWQRGLVLDDDYNGRALLEYFDDSVRITVRAVYPEGFLSVLTREVKWLVENFWAGLRCDVMVPCLEPRKDGEPCAGLYDVRKLIENKRRNRPEQPCPICNEWQSIDRLLHNAPTARQMPLDALVASVSDVSDKLNLLIKQDGDQHRETLSRFDVLDANVQLNLSKLDNVYTRLMQELTDEAKEGPRLFSFQPVDPGFFDRPKWISQKFLLTLWCEHSRLPLPSINGEKDNRGVYELELTRDWFVKATPFLKILGSTLSLVLPVAASATKLALDEKAYKGIEKQLEFGNKSLESMIKGGEQAGEWLSRSDAPDIEHGDSIRAQGAVLRQLHAFLKEKDPSFGGLIRVRNKRQEFLWVHPQFEKEY